MARSWQKTAIYSWNFNLFLTFFKDYGHVYVPNGEFWGSTGRPHIGDLVMNLFFNFGNHHPYWGWPKNAVWRRSFGADMDIAQRGGKIAAIMLTCIFDFRLSRNYADS